MQSLGCGGYPLCITHFVNTMLLFFTGIIHYRVFLFFRRSLNRQPCTHQTYRAGNECTHVQYERALSWRGVLQVIVLCAFAFNSCLHCSENTPLQWMFVGSKSSHFLFFYLCIYVVYQFNRPAVHVPPSGNLVVSMRPLKPADAIKATVCINITMLGLRS